MSERRTERSRRRARAGAAMALCLVVAGCAEPDGGGDSADPAGRRSSPDTGAVGVVTPPTAVDTSVAVASVDSSEWTIAQLSAPASLGDGPPPVPVLSALRTGSHAEYERMTLELAPASGLPGYRLEYVDRPLHECGSGRQVFPVGDAWLELRLEPAAAHTEAGAPTLGDREIAVGGPVLLRIYRTCDFEGVVTLVLAVSAPNPFRVVTLSGPTRLAVDVQR